MSGNHPSKDDNVRVLVNRMQLVKQPANEGIERNKKEKLGMIKIIASERETSYQDSAQDTIFPS